MRRQGMNRVGGGPRGDVDGFSPGSRRRMFEKLARIDLKPGETTFLTLTYPKTFPVPKRAKKDLRAFLKRLFRDHPEVGVLWRMEFQQRGAPHFHLMIFNAPFIDHRELRQDWEAVLQWEGKHHLQIRIEQIDDAKKAGNYVAKYMGKMDPRKRASGIFNSVTKVTASAEGDSVSSADTRTGRVWGIDHPENIPWAAKESSEHMFGRWFVELKSEVRQMFPRISDDTAGFMVFSDKAADIYARSLDLTAQSVM